MANAQNIVATEAITSRILIIRGQRIMIDADLAELYGVETKRLNEQVKRNRERFPADFMFQLTADEKAEVVANCDHLAKRLAELEEKTEALTLQHDSFAHNTRVQLKQVVEAIRQLTVPPDRPKRPIGFTTKLVSSTGETRD